MENPQNYLDMIHNEADLELTPVPSCVDLQKPEYFWYEGLAVYAREINYSAEKGNERICLKGGPVNDEGDADWE